MKPVNHSVSWNWIWVNLLLLLPGVVNAQVQLEGPLSGTIETGRYEIVGEITVEEGEELVIQSGVTFAFQDTFTFTVYGRLVANGVSGDSVYYYPDNPLNRWGGIDFIQVGSNGCLLEYCSISGSQSSGIYCLGSSPNISNCSITGSSGEIGRGGGIHCFQGSDATITNCTIRNNHTRQDGGGIFASDFSHPTITGCLVTDNSSDYGGGIYCNGGTAVISDCIVTGNHANRWGGGLYIFATQVNIDHCLFYDNSSDMTGGGVHFNNAFPQMTNCTVTLNSATDDGSGIYAWHGGRPVITNTIIAENFNGGIYLEDSLQTFISYCLLNDNEGGDLTGLHRSATGQLSTVNANGDSTDSFYNLFSDPRFIDMDQRDFHLQRLSPCIDAGDPDIEHDPDGTPPDIGVYSYNQAEIRGLTIPLQDHYFECISSNLIPAEPEMEALFGTLPGLQIIYDHDGGIFIPGMVNTIGRFDHLRGYYLYTDIPSTLTITGTAVPPHSVFSITANRWNWIAYPLDVSIPIETALVEIAEEIEIVFTDDGRFWIPGIPLNTIGNMSPGEGYSLFSYHDLTFSYHWNLQLGAN